MKPHHWRVLAQASIVYFTALLGWFLGINYAVSLPEILAWFPYFASFATGGYIGSKINHRIYLITSIFGTLAATSIGGINLLSDAIGFDSDFPGISGSILVGALSFPFILICALFGSVLGSYAHPSD
ncbi:MAG: hypothetical protein AB9M53_01260 [Leptothrix sp. (in: b-proteobacteria)]